MDQQQKQMHQKQMKSQLGTKCLQFLMSLKLGKELKRVENVVYSMPETLLRGQATARESTRLKYSKINYDSVIIEGIYTYIFGKTTLR